MNSNTHNNIVACAIPGLRMALTCTLLLGASFAYTPAHATPEQDIQDNYIQGLKDMTNELMATGMNSLAMIGAFFDADQALDTQLEYKRLQAEANKDYYPSETMCQFGTFVRSVARTEAKADADKLLLNDILISSDVSQNDMPTAQNASIDMPTRLEQFKRVYCNPADNNGQLGPMCTYDNGSQVGGADPNRFNKDVDFTRTLDSRLTVNVNMMDDPTAATAASEDEEDIHALARNLYLPIGLPTISNSGGLREVRELLAMKNIAQNSYVNIVASKSSAAEGNGEGSGWNFMKAMMRDFGLSDEDIHEALGDYPSYHAQMDVLTKKMYQSPSFYTHLYDKPTNVERISASMESIRLMQLRDQYKSALRREMLLSALLSHEVRKPLRDSLAVLDTN